MRKKIYFLLFILLLPFQKTAAQWEIGLSGGYVYNKLTTDPGYFYNRKYSGESGFSISLPVQYQIKAWFAVASGLSYIRKDYSWERPCTGLAFDTERTKNSFIELPLMLRFSYGGKKLRGFTDVGMFLGGWTGSRIAGIAINPDNLAHPLQYKKNYHFNSQKDNRFEYGSIAGIGIRYRYSPNISIFTELAYLYSLSDLQKDYMKNQYARYNNTLQLQLGIMYTIKRK